MKTCLCRTTFWKFKQFNSVVWKLNRGTGLIKIGSASVQKTFDSEAPIHEDVFTDSLFCKQPQ